MQIYNHNEKLMEDKSMESWQQFEDNCYIFLQDSYGDKCDIQALGKSDSTLPDIRIRTRNSTFYIEVKQPNAQSGQFVLLPDPDNQEFIFSPRNKTAPNDLTDIIIDYMNNDFYRFNSAGTAGQSLDINISIFNQWIVDYYQLKGVKYLITKRGSYIIFPITKFDNYFDVSATYRIKRSGSSEPSKKYQPDVISILKSQYDVSDTLIRGKKLFASGDNSISKVRFVMGDYEYYLAPNSENIYEVRQLSNTYNMNVIFSILLKKGQSPSDLALFEGEL